MEFTAHAYLAEGDASVLESLSALLAKAGEAARGDEDYFERAFDSLGVDEARDTIAARTVTKPFRHARKVIVFSAVSVTNEAQNALLKAIEEPSAPTLIIFVTPRPQMLLATVRSRMETLKVIGVEGESGDAFLKATSEKRLDVIKGLLGKDSEDRDLSEIFAFLTSLERTLAGKKLSDAKEGLAAVYRAKKYIGDKGALVKSLLEQVALLTPRL